LVFLFYKVLIHLKKKIPVKITQNLKFEYKLFLFKSCTSSGVHSQNSRINIYNQHVKLIIGSYI